MRFPTGILPSEELDEALVERVEQIGAGETGAAMEELERHVEEQQDEHAADITTAASSSTPRRPTARTGRADRQPPAIHD